MSFELLILTGTGVLVLGLSVCTWALASTGNLRWNAAISRDAKFLWWGGFIVGTLIIFVFAGLPTMLAFWPFFVVVPLLAMVSYTILDLITGVRPLSRPIVLPEISSSPSWDVMWRSYEGKPVPLWMMQAATQGEVRYDGKVARIVNGVLVPTTTPTPLNIERLFKRLDDLLG